MNQDNKNNSTPKATNQSAENFIERNIKGCVTGVITKPGNPVAGCITGIAINETAHQTKKIYQYFQSKANQFFTENDQITKALQADRQQQAKDFAKQLENYKQHGDTLYNTHDVTLVQYNLKNNLKK